MARIHDTTMTPTKLELLTAWLPSQPWYRGTGRNPALHRAGGFRLDDPDGEVGIEVLFVTDSASTIYQVPLSYRGVPLEGAEAELVGTAEHGVLGPRWIYDGLRDPVAVAQLLALVSGDVVAQHQSVSDTPDPSVTRTFHLSRSLAPAARGGDDAAAPTPQVVGDGEARTTIAVELAGGGASPELLALHVLRVLSADDDGAGRAPEADGDGTGQIVGTVDAEVRPPDRAPVRRRVVVLERGAAAAR
jgi:Maltokinase N-terminal cap domain